MCLSGYALKESVGGRPLLCRNGQWIGHVPSCVRAEVSVMRQVHESMCPSSSHGLCDQLCSVNRDTGRHECSCFRGFAMQEDGVCAGECVCPGGLR